MATITGTIGNDTIKGTTANDKMIGLAGNDTYTVDDCDDVVTEAPGEGTDTVFASHYFKLSDNVENLTLTGAAATDGFGNDGNNVMTGNAAPTMLINGAMATTPPAIWNRPARSRSDPVQRRQQRWRRCGGRYPHQHRQPDRIDVQRHADRRWLRQHLHRWRGRRYDRWRPWQRHRQLCQLGRAGHHRPAAGDAGSASGR